jgi:hypothetical protein
MATKRDIDTSGYRGWWEAREFAGRGPQGEKLYREVFRNMETGEVHAPENGWDGEPPRPSGELIQRGSDLYRENYEKIQWNS